MSKSKKDQDKKKDKKSRKSGSDNSVENTNLATTMFMMINS